MITNTFTVVLILFGTSFVNFSSTIANNDVTGVVESVRGRILSIKNEIRSLCSHIELTTLSTAHASKTLVRDAHIFCPNYTEMKSKLSDMEKLASDHCSIIKKTVEDCLKLSNMMTNGEWIASDLHGDDYSRVRNTIDKWRESFVKFSVNFNFVDTSIERMFDHSKVFYHDGFIFTIKSFLITIMMLLFNTTIVTLIFIAISFISGAAQILYDFIESFNQNSSEIIVDNDSADYNLLYNGSGRIQQTIRHNNTRRANSFEIVKFTSVMKYLTKTSLRFYTIVGVLSWILIFCLLFAITFLWNPAVFSCYKPIRYNWYPRVESTLKMIINDMDSLHSRCTRQLGPIEELSLYVSTNHARAKETAVSELMLNLYVFEQINQEISNVHVLNERMLSRLRRMYKQIQEKAKTTGKLNETYELLVEVNFTIYSIEVLQSTLKVVVSDQEDTVSSLSWQGTFMHELVKDNEFIELGRVIRYYRNALIYINGNISKLEMAVNQVILELVDNGQMYEQKSIVATLIETSIYDAIKAIVVGSIESATGTIVGMLTIRTGYRIAIIAPSTVTGPAIAIAAGLGMISTGVSSGVNHFDNYIKASRFKSLLAVLEIETSNVETTMKQLKKAVSDQKKTSTSSNLLLSRLIKYCNSSLVM
jgi:hypothetical protein